MKPKRNSEKATSGSKRVRISQEDVPAYSLTEALRVATTLHENFGKDPANPLRLAAAMNFAPGSSSFKMLCGASIAYGLTSGGYNAASISLLPLAQRVVKPLSEGDDATAKREAFLRPRVIGEFLKKYDGSPLPKTDIGKNVLEDLGVPHARAEAVFDIIITGARELGLLQEIKGKSYVDLAGTAVGAGGDPERQQQEEVPSVAPLPPAVTPGIPLPPKPPTATNRKVFITHGKNRAFVDPIKKLLQFGEMEPVVSVEKQSVSQPVPDKVMSDMRACSAAIIHVEDELRLVDKDANEQIMLNPNVLIEIGAAMALFGR